MVFDDDVAVNVDDDWGKVVVSGPFVVELPITPTPVCDCKGLTISVVLF